MNQFVFCVHKTFNTSIPDNFRISFEESGNAKGIFESPRTLFVSEEEHRLALPMRVKLCDKAGHKGERVMVCNDANFNYKKGAPVHCKSCKMGKSRQVTATKGQERIVVYATAEEWFEM